MMRVYDVIVVGFGLAGAVACAESARRGAKTLAIEIGTPMTSGGNSLISGQGVLSTDNVSSFVRYLSALGVRHPSPYKWAESVELIPEMLLEFGVKVSPSKRGGDFTDAPGWPAVLRWRSAGPVGVPIVRVVQDRARTLGVEVAFRARAVGVQRHSSRSMDVTFDRAGRRHTVRAQRGVVLACGGYAASLARCASLGTPFARGDGIALAAQLGAKPNRHGAISGPYYGFRVPGTRAALTPWPLYFLQANEDPGGRPRLVSRAFGDVVTPPPSALHGLRCDPDGRYRRFAFPDALLVITDAELAKGPLVRAWPDAHAEGWARRFGEPWSNSNEREIALGWLHPLEDQQRIALRLRRRIGAFTMNLEPVILNSLGGLRCDSSFTVLGRGGAIPGLYAAGELASRFGLRYQGSANLTECVISGREAVATALGQPTGKTAC